MAATQRYAPLAPNPTILAPTWAGSCLDRDALVPGGSKVDNTGFAGIGGVDAFGHLPIPSGTVVGRTITQRDANTGFHFATDTDVEYYLTADDRH